MYGKESVVSYLDRKDKVSGICEMGVEVRFLGCDYVVRLDLKGMTLGS